MKQKRIFILLIHDIAKFNKLPLEQKETFGSILKKKPYEWKDEKNRKMVLEKQPGKESD